jgi:hypothetical protein
MFTVPEHVSSPPIISGVHVAQSLVFWVVFCSPLFGLCPLAIVLSVFL